MVAVVAVALVGALYLYRLTGMGLIGPDEPRYAWIAREMARSGDWLTPRLWGEPWYEKPPLLYWLSGLGFVAGLDADLAPRLPVALTSLGFLAFFRWRVCEVWDGATANAATAILATSAGWLAFSHIAVTDLPLAAFFSAALLLCCGEKPRPVYAAIALGLAVLAKGLVPLVLFVPVAAVKFRLMRWQTIGAFAAVALPWFALETARNGGDMFRVLFMEQTFGRFTSQTLQHVQPWWFYLPVVLLLLFPWFPLLGLLRRAKGAESGMLLAVAIFGLVFFSVSVNKLPGYLLPLAPSACILMALGLRAAAHPARWLVAPLALLGLLPALTGVLPSAVAEGLGRAAIPWIPAAVGMLVAGAVAWLLMRPALLPQPKSRVATAGLLAGAAFVWFEGATLVRPDLASARPLWRRLHPECIAEQPRNTAYGVYYYAQRRLEPCSQLDPDPRPVVR